MRRVTLLLGMVIVLAFSLAIALALDDIIKSPAQLCRELGYGTQPAFDACVVCTAQLAGEASTPVCVCKSMAFFDPELYKELYKNQGDCIKNVRTMPPPRP